MDDKKTYFDKQAFDLLDNFEATPSDETRKKIGLAIAQHVPAGAGMTVVRRIVLGALAAAAMLAGVYFISSEEKPMPVVKSKLSQETKTGEEAKDKQEATESVNQEVDNTSTVDKEAIAETNIPQEKISVTEQHFSETVTSSPKVYEPVVAETEEMVLTPQQNTTQLIAPTSIAKTIATPVATDVTKTIPPIEKKEQIEESKNEPFVVVQDSIKIVQVVDSMPADKKVVDDAQPVPVVLNQKTDSVKRKRFADWLIGVHYMPEFVFGLTEEYASNEKPYEPGQSGDITLNARKENGLLYSVGIGAARYSKDIYSLVYYKPTTNANEYQPMADVDAIVSGASNGKPLAASSLAVSSMTDNLGMYGTFEQYTQRSYYNYLQLPVSIGYLSNRKKFMYGLKSGFAFSFLIKKSEFFVEDPNAEYISVEKRSTLQVDANWCTQTDAFMGYAFTKHLIVGVQPTFKYYLGSLSKQTTAIEVKHPITLGIKGSVYLKL